LNEKLKETPFELAYRALNELLLSVKCFHPADDKSLVAVWDDFLMQKVLPRIEGDAEKILYNGEENSGLLNELCSIIDREFQEMLGGEEELRPDLLNRLVKDGSAPQCPCKSLEKLQWMQRRLEQNQYTAFWA